MTAYLTLKQVRLLDFITQYVALHRVAPSTEEMMRELSLTSKSSVNRMIDALVARGAITRIPNRARAIAVAPTKPRFDLSDLCIAIVKDFAESSGASETDIIEASLVDYLKNHPKPGQAR